MAIKLTQSLKQTQSLMMTPQLQQAIKMLTLTHLEMTNVIAKEMVENPMLEEIDGDTSAKKGESDYKAEKLEMENAEAKADNFEQSTVIQKDDFDWNSYIENYNTNSQSPPSMVSRDPDDAPDYENMVSQTKTLAEHLEWQLRMESLTSDEWKIAEQIIHNINGDGYLEAEIEEIILATGHKKSDVLEILHMIQNLDPVGCGARNTLECLIIQAKMSESLSPLVESILRNHLESLKNKNYEKISEALETSVDNVKEAELIIQSFHPKPGRLVVSEETHYVVPDIFVNQVGGEFVVQVNEEGVPRLRISQLYQSMLKNSKDKDPKAREYVQEKLRSAMWLIKSIQNRQKTIIRVAQAIVRQQQEFFKKGPEYLQPMVLRDIAEEIGMHESTVSRVTTNKYMHTPIGLFELKYFFNSGLGGKNGGIDISNEVLKIKLKKLIESENIRRPFSDQKLAELLSQDDVKIARRTVAKYREMLGVESSSKRKKRG